MSFCRGTFLSISLDVEINDTADGIRVDISGDGGEALLRRRAEALDALQVIVNTAFRRELKDDRSALSWWVGGGLVIVWLASALAGAIDEPGKVDSATDAR